jgi:hypothetical protein
MDRLLFGDNQFFGVNHMSEDKARSQAMRFRDFAAVMAVLDAARDEGITTFVCTTHERVAKVCAHVREHREEYPGYRFYPGMPYAHKYANAVTDFGLLGAVRRAIPEKGLVDATFRGGRAVARRDLAGLMTLLVDAEMKMFSGLATPVVFLQNVVVDLLLGIGFLDAFQIFAEHVRASYGAEPGFMTMNLPMLVEALDRVGVSNPIVCANFNKLGFRMSGGLPAYRAVVADGRVRLVAMSVFASGAIPADQAVAWVCEQPNVEAILFGASSAANIRSTCRLVGRYWDLDGGDRGSL